MADVRQVINRVKAGDTIEMVNFFQGIALFQDIGTLYPKLNSLLQQ